MLLLTASGSIPLPLVLDGLNASEIALLKASTTQRLVETVKLPVPVPLPDAALHTLVSATVDALFSCMLSTELGASALAPEEQLARVRRLEAEAQAEAAFLQRKSEREVKAVARRLAALQAQKVEIKEEIRRSRSWF